MPTLIAIFSFLFDSLQALGMFLPIDPEQGTNVEPEGHKHLLVCANFKYNLVL